jgi:hypothetical protein
MSLHSKKNYPLTDKILMETKISWYVYMYIRLITIKRIGE